MIILLTRVIAYLSFMPRNQYPNNCSLSSTFLTCFETYSFTGIQVYPSQFLSLLSIWIETHVLLVFLFLVPLLGNALTISCLTSADVFPILEPVGRLGKGDMKFYHAYIFLWGSSAPFTKYLYSDEFCSKTDECPCSIMDLYLWGWVTHINKISASCLYPFLSQP